MDLPQTTRLAVISGQVFGEPSVNRAAAKSALRISWASLVTASSPKGIFPT